jgi:hypothetical protein
MGGRPGPAPGKPLLFWDEKVDGGLGQLLDFFNVVPGGRKYGQPRDHIRQGVPKADREELARALQLRSATNPIGGDVLMGYMGWADCRICGERLGTRDFFGRGFTWPELADHYILVHDVWTKECDELLAAVRRDRRRGP